MADQENVEISKGEKREVTTGAEETRPGPLFSPAVDIFETDQAITVLADMPGVHGSDLDIDLREHVLTLRGEAKAPESEGEQEVLREWVSGMFFRQFTLADTIDEAKIEATLRDGVLRLTLPKVDRAKPRRIDVKSS